MLDFIAQVISSVVSATEDIRQLVRRWRIEQHCGAAKTAITTAKNLHVSLAEDILSRESYADDLSVTWQDVLNLGDPFKGLHERRLEDLETRIVDNTEEKGEWFAVPDPATVNALQAPRVAAVRAQAESDLTAVLEGALEAALKQFDKDCRAISNSAEGFDQTQLRAMTAEKRSELLQIADATNARQDARKKLDAAKPNWAGRVRASYRNMLLEKLVEFNSEERPKLIVEVERNRTAAYWIKKLLLEGESVPSAKLSGIYQISDQHLQDQLINTVTLTVMENGELAYRARERNEGGRFPFEKNYMDPSEGFKKQVENTPPDPQARSSEDRVLPFALRFLDQVRVPATSSARLTQAGSFDLRQHDRVDRVLLQFAGDVQGVPLDADESQFRDLPYVTNYPGTKRITDWLKGGAARQISVALRPDGLLAVVVKLNDRKTTYNSNFPGAVIRLRTDYNQARLMSLLIVALVTRVLYGASFERFLPERCGESERLHIPSFCIWPLQVDPQGAVTKAETVLEQFAAGKLTREAVPRWAVGWTPALHSDAPMVDALEARFTSTAERHLRVLNSTDAGPIKVRKGVNEHDALYKLTLWFKYTCLAGGALWAAAVLSTLVVANAYTINELWAITFLFSLIGIWRCLICWGLSSRAGEAGSPALRSRWSSRLVSTFSEFVDAMIDLAFTRRQFLLIGPVILAVAIGAAYLISEWPDLSPTLKPNDPKAAGSVALNLWGNNSETATGFQKALYKGVWALPLLAIGLMRHGYMLLYDLVLQRGQLQRKLSSVVGVAETWSAGRAMPSLMSAQEGNAPTLSKEKAAAISAAIAQMKSQVTEDLAAARSRFDKGSAANAALVAVIGLLAPFSQMSAATLSKVPDPDAYAGLSAELEKAHPALVEALRPLVPKWDGPTETQVKVTPQVLADLGKLNTELTSVLETLRQIQAHRDVNITARTEEAHRRLGGLLASFERLQPAPLKIEADTTLADKSLRALEERTKQMQLPDVMIKVDTQNAQRALYAFSRTLGQMQPPAVTLETEKAHSALEELSRTMRRMAHGVRVPLDAEIGAALRDLGLLKAVLEQMQEGISIPVAPEGRVQSETVPWIKVDLAFNNAATQPGSLPLVWRDALMQCDKLGGMRFPKGKSDLKDGVWFNVLGKDGTRIDEGEAALDALIARAQDWKAATPAATEGARRLYILGLTDARGNATSNLDLSKRRADTVKRVLSQKLTGFSIVVLPLGESGWLTGEGLPEQEDDANHRSATVFLCPEAVRFAGDQGKRETQ
ncbi:hypothetical protein [Leisingera sp. M658]|uniref:hypothetical protein n=1 Tax=Leisingera sp. M658 TaxID=2867015 RepID=UPI0021A2616C|nr:hypothetical protein [Leisingera sp. M658]UWQ74414.1 hypothetical protein K3724_18345 [Leisingera sp. M658]